MRTAHSVGVVDFPLNSQGKRSDSDFGKAVVSAALRSYDPTGAHAAQTEPSWRSGYPAHMRRLVEAGVSSEHAWQRIAHDGLDAVHSLMTMSSPEGDRPLSHSIADPCEDCLSAVEVQGLGAPTSFVLPYRGKQLRGSQITKQVATWIRSGIAEPSLGDAIEAVLDNPGWLCLEGRTVAVLGATAEMSPTRALLRWGATVAAVDLPVPDVWTDLLNHARLSAGRMLIPCHDADESHDAPKRAGVDLHSQVPEIAQWLARIPGPIVVGNYVYADTGLYVRVSAAADLLVQRLQREHEDVAMTFLASPTDVFVLPFDLAGPGCKIFDGLMPQQGPSYALAQHIQRWRATIARSNGTTTSFHVAPPTRAAYVQKSPTLATVFEGASSFGVEIFEPSTARTLMAALLVHDLHVRPRKHPRSWQDESHIAVHGGLWRTATPRSALGIVAMLAMPATP